jgi:hypothetical protein
MQRTDKPLSRGRKLAVRVVAVLGLLLFSFFFSIVALNTLGIVPAGAEGSPEDPPPSAEARFGAAHPGEAVHAAGAVAVVAIGASGLVALIARPERPGHAYQVLASMTAVLLTLPVVGDPDNVGGQAGPLDPFLLVVVMPAVVAALLAAPWRRRDSEKGWRPRLLVLAAIAAIPAAWYGVEQALFQRNTFPPTADPHHNAHWWAMAIVAFMVVLLMMAAALPGRGWGLGAIPSAVAAISIGAASLMAGSAASALEQEWAIAAITWGVVGVWLSVREAVAARNIHANAASAR